MKNLYKSSLYQEDIAYISGFLDIDKFPEKKILITGVTGMIGSVLADACLAKGLTVFGMGRNKSNAEKRFCGNNFKGDFQFIEHDVINPLNFNIKVDCIIHAASNAYPKMFDEHPVGTMLANIYGLNNMMEYARKSDARVVYISSGEVYGQSKGIDFDEEYQGFVDILNYRSCYPSAKRAAETLCSAYIKEYGSDVVIARLSHIYGATATEADTRAATQFIRDGIENKDIIMKSTGQQVRTYTYVADAAAGIFHILQNGQNGQAYNIAAPEGIVSIKQLAEIIANICKVNIQIVDASSSEKNSYNPVLRSVLSSDKIKELGFNKYYNIRKGIERTIKILK